MADFDNDTVDNPEQSNAASNNNNKNQSHSGANQADSHADTMQQTQTEEEDHIPNEGRRAFLRRATGIVGGIGIAAVSVPFIKSWSPSDKAQAAGAPVDVDISDMVPGEQLTVEWRGKPVWIIRRNKEMVAQLAAHEDKLRDPESLQDQQPQYAENTHRSIKEEYIVLVGICTHLGCSPSYRPNLGELGPNWPGGFFCPCHCRNLPWHAPCLRNYP